MTLVIGFEEHLKGFDINNGRWQSPEGPTAIRSQIAKLCNWGNQHRTVYDVGNIGGPNHSLEEPTRKSPTGDPAHENSIRIQPIVLGGGHGTAYGHYLGIQPALEKDEQLAVINLDAHLDL